MSGFYEGLQITASCLIKAKGQAMVLVKDAAGVYDAATSTTGLTSTRYAARGLSLDFPLREVDGVRVLAGDKRVVLEALDLTVDVVPGDSLEYGAQTFEVVEVSKKAPAGTNLVWVLQVREG